MSIVPLTIKGEAPTIVTDRAKFKTLGKCIFFDQVDVEQFAEKSRNSNVSYDLRIGSRYRDHRDDKGVDLLEGKKIEIAPGMAVIIQTEEWIHLPDGYFGQISPKVSLLQKGISNTHSKIDPGYNGRLLVTVFNLGKRKVFLERGEKFCSVFFSDVNSGALLYNKSGKEIASVHFKNRFRKTIDYFDVHAGSFSAISTFLSAIATLIGIYFLAMQFLE